jgi:hypothetical protein
VSTEELENREASETIDVEIFKAGCYPQGEVTEADLEELAAAYDPAVHEAPVTLDHARCGPALGWVAGLKRVGDRLVATLRGVSERLRELVRSGAYRKRSAEIYLDFNGTGSKYLRAVTFLGAGVPEVKGLSDVQFDEQGGAYAAIPCDLKPGVASLLKRRLKGLLRLLEAQGPAAQIQAQPETQPIDVALFREEARREAERALADERRQLDRLMRAHAAAVFVEGLLGEGRLLPCWAEGLAAFTLHLEEGAQESGVAFFAEAGQTPAAWFREWLAGLPRLVEFAEVCAPEREGSAGDAATRLQDLALERMRLKPELTFGEAFREVCAAQPLLAAEYLDDVS